MRIHQGTSSKRVWGNIALSAVLLLVTCLWTLQIDHTLGNSAMASGGVLFAVLVFLAFFSARKRLSFLPLAPASFWFQLHTIGGFLALFLFWNHTGNLEGKGVYGQVLTVLFYMTSISGILGLILEKIYPRQLTCTGTEVIYERIPAEIASIREEVENQILKCTEETGSSTLADHYLETLRWYFQKPRFFLHNIFGSHLSQHWVRQQCIILERFLNEKERHHLDKVHNLAEYKRKIDFHYALQTMLKTWLLVHIPLAGAVMAMVAWHLILIFVFFV